MSAKNKIKKHIEKNIKKQIKKKLNKFVIPFISILILISILVSMILTLFEGTSSEGVFDINLTEDNNKVVQKYIEKKLKTVNDAVQIDYFHKVLGHLLSKEEITNFVSYLNQYEETTPNTQDGLINHYKRLIDKAIDTLAPEFHYKTVSGTIKKEYKTLINKWESCSGLANSSRDSLNYTITGYMTRLDVKDFSQGVKIYDYNTQVLYEVKGKVFAFISRGVPYELRNHIFLANKGSLPEAKDMKKDSIIYVLDENKTYYAVSKLETMSSTSSEEYLLLTKAVTYKNTYIYDYKIKTEEVVVPPDGSEEGKVQGDIVAEIKKPLPSGVKTEFEKDYEKLRKILKEINQSEDFEFVINMLKYSKDIHFNWLFGEPGSFNVNNSLMGNDIPPELIGFFQEVSKIVNIPAAFLAAIAKNESGFDPTAMSTTEAGHAYGLMQIWEPDWDYIYNDAGLKPFLDKNGFSFSSSSEAFSVYTNNPRLQIFVGGWFINKYLNCSLEHFNVIPSPYDYNAENMSKIDWNHVLSDKSSKDFLYVASAVAIYNSGPGVGFDIDLSSESNGVAIYVRKVMNSYAQYSSQGTIVEVAMKLLNLPYLWGGASPDDGGMDCSGFIQYIHKQIGIDLPRTTYTQIDCSNVEVVSGPPEAGDLIFINYEYGSTPEHVALYIGDDKFIEAAGDENDTSVGIANSRNHKIKITEYNSYLKSVTCGIRRIKK